MPQHKPPPTTTFRQVRGEAKMNEWNEMNRYVEFARTQSMTDMPEWERLKWLDELQKMYRIAHGPLISALAVRKQYPRGEESETVPLYPPTLALMQEARDEIAKHLENLASGNGTFLGPFKVSFSVRFIHVHDAYGRQNVPRHIINRGEVGELVTNIYHTALLRHMTRLLETYCDQIRHCSSPTCRKLFLQNRLDQEYCSRRCQSIAITRKRRASQK